MKRATLLFITFLLIGATARAADVDKVLTGLQSYWETVDTFTARFVQKKRLALFTDEVTSRGTFAYKKPDIMIWRYDPPDDTVMSIKPGLITLYFPSLKKAKRIHLSSGADIPKGMSFGMGTMKDITALKDSFMVTVMEKDGATVMTLTPRDTKEAIREIAVSFMKDFSPLSTTIIEATGDSTTITFSDRKTNIPVNDALFDVRIPEGVVIEEIGK